MHTKYVVNADGVKFVFRSEWRAEKAVREWKALGVPAYYRPVN